ncbi:hypothetical protein [Aliivibrio sifiae]|uniref:Uncharacterized protein n=1 Tax=Aliivibrio sifiae TaxID=566293 RepID=A0ABQ6AGN1_9GAMM|nr:hypothetical protein [Aliivibrio sifiae]GLR73304.1 hypothetical protein GCM10007855_01770 [Aliivibrio sifiae]
MTSSLKSAVVVNEQNGIWSKDDMGNPIYQLDLGGTIRDTITILVNMPFNWQASEHDMLGYIASGSSQGRTHYIASTER